MQIKFSPNYVITSKIANSLMRIEAVKEKILHRPLTATVLTSLRETARLYTTHYSTMIEGNRLGPDQIEVVLKHEGHFPGRERDECEVKGYYAALTKVEQLAAAGAPITEKIIQALHTIVMADAVLLSFVQNIKYQKNVFVSSSQQRNQVQVLKKKNYIRFLYLLANKPGKRFLPC